MPGHAGPNLLRVAGLVSLLVLLLGVIGLFALSQAYTKSDAALGRLEALHSAQVAAVTAQVGFKTQVQEWKNVLLRGGNAQDYATHVARFEQREADVRAGLGALQGALTRLGLDGAAAARLAAEHAALGAAMPRSAASIAS